MRRERAPGDVCVSPPSMKTVFITSFHILIGRNILATDALRAVLARGIRVVLIVPDYKKEYFVRQFGGPGVVVEGIAAYSFSRAPAGFFFKRLARPMAGSRTSLLKARQKLFIEKRIFYYAFFLLPARLLGATRLGARLARFLDFHLASKKYFFRPLFERYRPALVVATEVNDENDVALLQDAKRCGIPTLGLVRSWDGPTNFLMRCVPDRVAVWNTMLKSILVTRHLVPAEAVHVIGIPHYDRYARGPMMSREAFFAQIGADPAKRLILYGPVTDFRLPENDVDTHVLRILSRLDATILVRLPPAAVVTMDRSAFPPNVRFQDSGLLFKNRGDSELTPEDDERLLNDLAWCDLMVSGPGTINIDAAFLDKPNVLINFFPGKKTFYEGIVEYGFDHIQPILQSKGVRVAKSEQELVMLVEQYFRDPGLDREGRARIVREQCGFVDGMSGRRLAALIVGAVGETI